MWRPEFYTAGAKLLTLASHDGKLRSEQIGAPVARAAALGVHHVQPAALSITQSTEWGTVYTPDEVRALAAAARQHGLRLHMDGARFANAIAHLGCSAAEATWQAGVDVLSLGASKNGAMAAEAVIFFDPALARSLPERRKRGGHLWSKMRYLSVQLDAYFTDGLWVRHAQHANGMAARLAAGLAALPGIRLVQPVQANEVFARLPEPVTEGLLAQGFTFYRWHAPEPGGEGVVRLVTSFATEIAAVDALLSAAAALAARCAA